MTIVCLIVGRGYSGVTSLAITYSKNEFPDEAFLPSVYDTYVKKIPIDNKLVNLGIKDVGIESEYKGIRQLEYQHCDIILVCFSLVSKKSFVDVKEKYAPEIREIDPQKKIVLAGLKSDLRDNLPENIVRSDVISTSEGEKLKNEIGALDYVECSSLNKHNLDHLFESVARACLNEQNSNLMKCFLI